MIDSHCHLDHEPLLENISEVIKRSKEVGISKLLTICTTIESFNRIKNISLESITNHNFLKSGDRINKIDILFKKIDKKND